jgi:hypothetical protein
MWAGRYLLFAGNADMPLGGWCDYVAAFNYLEDALRQGEASLQSPIYRQDWYHIVDRRTLKVVACGGEHPKVRPRIDV